MIGFRGIFLLSHRWWRTKMSGDGLIHKVQAMNFPRPYCFDGDHQFQLITTVHIQATRFVWHPLPSKSPYNSISIMLMWMDCWLHLYAHQLYHWFWSYTIKDECWPNLGILSFLVLSDGIFGAIIQRISKVHRKWMTTVNLAHFPPALSPLPDKMLCQKKKCYLIKE